MLSQRGDLLVESRQRLNEIGFEYKKGKSRSKRFGSDRTSEEESTPKRTKTDRMFRVQRIAQIKEEVKTLNSQIEFKQRRVEMGVQAKNFKLCDQVTDEVSELQKARRVLEIELQCLEKKDRKSQKYYRRKSSAPKALLSPSTGGESTDREESYVLSTSPSPSISSKATSPILTPRHDGSGPSTSSLPFTPHLDSGRRKSCPPVIVPAQDSGDTVILSDESDGQTKVTHEASCSEQPF